MIDLHNTGFNLIGVTHGHGDVAGDDRRAEAVFNVVGERNGFIEIAALHHAHHRAEDLFLCDAHGIFHVGDYCGAHEMAVLEIAFAQAFAAPHAFCALVVCDFDVVQIAFQFTGAHGGPHGDAIGHAVAHVAGLGLFH